MIDTRVTDRSHRHARAASDPVGVAVAGGHRRSREGAVHATHADPALRFVLRAARAAEAVTTAAAHEGAVVTYLDRASVRDLRPAPVPDGADS